MNMKYRKTLHVECQYFLHIIAILKQKMHSQEVYTSLCNICHGIENVFQVFFPIVVSTKPSSLLIFMGMKTFSSFILIFVNCSVLIFVQLCRLNLCNATFVAPFLHLLAHYHHNPTHTQKVIRRYGPFIGLVQPTATAQAPPLNV